MNLMTGEIFSHTGNGLLLCTEIKLPTTQGVLWDKLEQIRIYDDVPCKAALYSSEPTVLQDRLQETVDLYELNELAKRMRDLNHYEKMQFEGLIRLYQPDKERLSVSDLHNLLYNLDSVEVIPATCDAELAGFYLENDLLEPYKGISNDVYQHLDFNAIGQEQREAEKGVYLDTGYAYQQGEIQSFYRGEYALRDHESHIFKLSLTKTTSIADPREHTNAELLLPATPEKILEACEWLSIANLHDCDYCCSASTVPQLSHVFEGLHRFDAYNDLAKTVAAVTKSGNLLKYKAVLSQLEHVDMESAWEVTQHLDNFDLKQEFITQEDYAQEVLKQCHIPLPDELFRHAPLYDYGVALMKEQGAELTTYGILLSNSGLTIQQTLEQQNQEQRATPLLQM